MIMKSKIAKIGVLAVLFLTVLWIATPKVYVHKLLNHNHELIHTNGETSVQTDANPDCDFDKYDAPIYFTIFKFINNFVPLKPKHEAVLNYHPSVYKSFVKESDTSRAPTRA